MKKIIVVIMMIFAVGCAKKYAKTPIELIMEKEKTTTEEVQKEKEVEVVEEEPLQEAIIEDVSSVEESLFEFKDALFDFDKYNIRPDARIVLDAVAEWLNQNKYINILIEGHCDERGTNEYNLALGEKRVMAAMDYLISRGVAYARMSAITYGEERPICTEQNEDCWQKNRRAHFVVTK